MIYVSTSFFKNKYSINEISNLFLKNGITNIEFSGGIYENNILEKLQKIRKKSKIVFHNYFPVPKKSFVINISSLNKQIQKKSILHLKKAIRYSNKLNIKKYSFHAGFLFDPLIGKLGKTFQNTYLQDKNQTIDVFLNNLYQLSEYAKNYNVELLIENNVLTKKNYNLFKTKPFLMIDIEDCVNIMKNTPDNINMLVDVGHLNVSSKTLSFDRLEFLSKCKKWIKGYHLSDNDRLIDLNNKIKRNSWFLKHINLKDIYLSLEINTQSFNEINNQLLILNKNNK